MALDRNKLEIDRIENIIVNFDWKITKQEINDDNIIITIQKKCITPVAEVK